MDWAETLKEFSLRCVLYTQKHLVPPWCVKTSVVAINGYNFINIDMTQMVTFSNICPEWYT